MAEVSCVLRFRSLKSLASALSSRSHASAIPPAFFLSFLAVRGVGLSITRNIKGLIQEVLHSYLSS